MDTRKNALMGALALILGMPLAGHAQTDEEDFVSSVEVIPDFYNSPGIVDSASGAIGSAAMDVDPHSGTLTISHT
ncbi:hypothetical protein, partial [Alcanivorax sp.]|uniref:hypothetical protein n=1 Tax=Alcanivorax sp. TaxID=1872427 RepID=UPI002622513B